MSLEKWVDEARSNASPNAVLYVVCKITDNTHPPLLLQSLHYITLPNSDQIKVGSKLDKAASGSRVVSFEEGKAFAESHDAGFCEVSSKTRENVKKPFIEVVDQIVQKPELLPAPRGSDTLNLGIDTSSLSTCPC